MTCTKFVNSYLLNYPSIEIQCWGKPDKEPLNELIPTIEFRDRWNTANGAITCGPMNALNISGTINPPWPLTTRCGMLDDIVNTLTPVVGKKITKILDTDVESSLRFQLLGQAGAFSGWHVDFLAPITWVTLEKNDEDDRDGNDDVLKYWAVIEMNHLSRPEQQIILETFANNGPLWKPSLDLIRVVVLTPGMTLVMPPGTIPAPLTVSNCFFQGGMCWDKRLLISHHLPLLEWILDHRESVTNEDPHKQLPSVLRKVIQEVEADYVGFGIKSLQEKEEVVAKCNRIIEIAQWCQHSGPCRDRRRACVCTSNGHDCSMHCKCSCNK
jgi:hypothetical protein